MADINRLKRVQVETKKTSKWLAEQLGVNASTVSKWCTNSSQPDIASLLKISDLLEVDIKELIVSAENGRYPPMLKTDDIHPPKTGISVHFSCSLP